MADNISGVRISELAVAQTLSDTDMFPLETLDPESKQVTWQVMKGQMFEITDSEITAIYDELYPST